MSHLIKYPRTPLLPWSSNATPDDIRLIDTTCFINQEIVITEKLDGENTSMYHDHIHARSVDSRHHPSRDWVKRFHHEIAHEIPKGWRICGENMYAKHSIFYENLNSYFYGFSIWSEKNECLSWADTLEWFALLGIKPVPTLYQGVWDETLIRNIQVDTQTQEGYVVRLVNSFHYDHFRQSMAKWVRPKHVNTTQHWMFAELVPNQLQETNDE